LEREGEGGRGMLMGAVRINLADEGQVLYFLEIGYA
jgi:hypothetical protein